MTARWVASLGNSFRIIENVFVVYIDRGVLENWPRLDRVGVPGKAAKALPILPAGRMMVKPVDSDPVLGVGIADGGGEHSSREEDRVDFREHFL